MNPLNIRPLSFQRNFTRYAPGSVLIAYGHTKVLCTACITEGVPRFLKDSGKGWLTAEYSMLPSSTHTRSDREASKGKQSGRTQEIQRLIGRSFRSILDLSILGEKTIQLDADVIQADGGTRTAAITGCMMALSDGVLALMKTGQLSKNPIKEWVAAVSVGYVKGEPAIDLSYEQDSQADVDMNVVMTESGKFIEIQGTAEKNPFSHDNLISLLNLAQKGIQHIFSQIKP